MVTTFLIRQVLGDDALRAQYYKECESMAVRIGAMRAALRSELEAAGSAPSPPPHTDLLCTSATHRNRATLCITTLHR